MSRRRLPSLGGQERPANLAVLMREAFVALNDRVLARLVESGHGEVRPAHGAVFQYLDDTGTTVSVLAERAQMTKQAMAELVRHLETHGYVRRVPDPSDRRAKLVVPTERGHDVIATAQDLVPDLELEVGEILGADRVRRLRADLEAIRQTIPTRDRAASAGQVRQ
ncbi:DNA-binding MarR family transcriptional regulator [Pseudonocardia hierapolitana]|uniref:DNA-binding MarR family transcriptional regulator n=1 Tax=Pseudonocardia hierapolitana TaxID=1128676 RepID=A0A561T302_9PSEU|nr:MarR family transcriptional regulator [Pseudonocardia hierapolitana]TWF81485.1 DNA-binding MarR family transcriptional regulator [Pseudonocardia hierapolitana]